MSIQGSWRWATATAVPALAVLFLFALPAGRAATVTQNNGTIDPIAVTFDNFSLSAASIA